jgi:hypothetical protein
LNIQHKRQKRKVIYPCVENVTESFGEDAPHDQEEHEAEIIDNVLDCGQEDGL